MESLPVRFAAGELPTTTRVQKPILLKQATLYI
jgi:hypothetical protein